MARAKRKPKLVLFEIAGGYDSDHVRTVFEVAGLDAGVALCSSREEAIAHLSAAA